MEEFRTSDESVKRVFNEEQQAAIFARAAALQRDHGQLSTLSDLERAALEAGIEPRFVREAVRLQAVSLVEPALVAANPSSDHYWRTAMLSAILIPADIAALSWTHDLLASGWGALVFGVVFGLALPRRQYARYVAFAWPMFVALSIVVFDPHAIAAGVLLLGAIQGAISLGVNLRVARRPNVEPQSFALRQDRGSDQR
jgi:hypothetical protein